MKDLIAFSNGDSRDASVWSNVPYLFLSTLEKRGDVKIHRVNIALTESNIFLRVMAKIYNSVINRFTKEDIYTFQRTKFYSYLVQRKMKESLKKHPQAKWLLIFDFSNGLVGKEFGCKTILFCDWTIEYLVRVHKNRTPSRIEEHLIKRQNDLIAASDYVFTIFPNAQEFMQKKTSNTVYYCGNVINAIMELPSPEKLAVDRYQSKKILFIGRMSYLDAAKELVAAVELYNQSHTPMEVHIIGIDQEHFKDKEFVNCYGYLRKDVDKDRETYYSLISKCKFLVNTQPNWVGASSIIEVLHFGLPVVINPNQDLIKTFGENIEFGCYCNQNNKELIAEYIEKMCELPYEEYKRMSQVAEEVVSDFTWDAYIERLLKIINFQ